MTSGSQVGGAAQSQHFDNYEFDRVSKDLREATLMLLKEQKLFEFEINERTLTQRLSLHLQPFFEELSVDCESNRQWIENHNGVKKLDWYNHKEFVGHDDTEGKTVYPDIIVHKRGQAAFNILVIEAKRNAPGAMIEDKRFKDYLKLCAFTDQSGAFRYRWGAFINQVPRGEQQPIAQIDWFENGTKNGKAEELRPS